jgi:uncharacterized protein YgiM (DUF1202 family)
MRRAYILVLACLVLLVPLLPVSAVSDDAVAVQTGPYAVSSGAVNVRGGPGTGFWIRGTLYLGEVVPITGISPDGAWWYIKATFGEGWIAGVGVTAYHTESVAVYDPGPIGTVTAGVVNVRYGAGEYSTSLGQVSMGQQVYVLARNADGSWLQIRWGYGTGWIAARFLTVTGLPATVVDDGSGGMAEPSTSAVPLTSDTPYALVMATYLNVRTGPGINYAVLGAAYGGETLPIVGRTADSTWYQVETRYGTGWVSASFVVTRNEYGGTPVTTGTVTAETPVTGPIGIINTGALNIRSGPGVQYSSIGTLAGGTQTRIVGRTADWSWWLLDTPVGTGWANAIYIIVRGDTSSVPYVPPGSSAAASPGAPEATAPEAVVSGPVAFVATGALNIRSGPNSTFPSLGSVTAGTRMPIIGQSPDRGWWYVESPYGNGYVSKLYVIAEGNTSGVPVVQ